MSDAPTLKAQPINPYTKVTKKRQAASPPPAASDFAAPAEKQQVPAATAATTVVTTNVFAGNKGNKSGVEYWERLPSKNLSFGSAEILTVDECVVHAALYQGRSVRVTGQRKKRSVQGQDGAEQVVLELVHPLPATTPRTPVTTPRKPLSASKLQLLRKRKRPLFATKSQAKPKPKSLSIFLDPTLPHLDGISEGSIVTIMGTMLESGAVQARLFNTVQHTDMNFYVGALKARRKMLYRRYEEHHQVETNKGPVQGCGPPPYDSFDIQSF